MKLFLASEIKNPKTIEDLSNYIQGFKGKTIAYIPTAANGEGWESWKEGGSWETVQNLGAEITLVQLEDYRNESVVDLIKGKDIFWMAGGMTGYLLYWIRRCKLDKYIKEILDSGTLYVGSSAGSMITSHDQDFAEWYIGEEEPGASLLPGLGLVDFDFYPHYEDHLHEQIKQKYTGKKIYLVKNGEAIIVEDGNVKVLGEERIESGGDLG